MAILASAAEHTLAPSTRLNTLSSPLSSPIVKPTAVVVRQQVSASQSLTFTPAYTLYLPFVQYQLLPKHGVVNLTTCSDVARVGGMWTYDYSVFAPTCPGIENVPMVIETPTVYVATGNSAYLLGFNEPNNPNEGGHFQPMADAVRNWHTVELSYPNRLLVSPVPASSLPYNSDNWLATFRTTYTNTYHHYPRFDALAVHAYFSYAWEGQAMVISATAQARAWGIPEVWVTEMGIPYQLGTGTCAPIPSQAYTETRTFLSWANTQVSVTHYAWFGTFIDIPAGIKAHTWPRAWCDLSLILTDTNHTLTSFGQAYISQP